jgi:outer membrane protein
MKKSLTVFFFLIGTLVSSAAWAGDKVAYLNLQLIVAESELGKQAREDFNRQREKAEGEIKGKIKEIESLNAELNKEREKEPIDQRKIAAVIDRLQQGNKEYERFVADMKEELARKDQDLVRRILEKVAPILTELATSRGYAVIFKNAADLAYVAPAADISKEVIERLNQPNAGKGEK